MPVMDAKLVADLLRNGDGLQQDVDIPPKFTVGERVRTKVMNPSGHCRLPRYARGHVGTVIRDHGVFPFPDTNFAGNENLQHVYLVEFLARDLWGPEASDRDTLRLDLWDDHLLALEDRR